MSATAVSISNGVTNSDLEEFKIKSAVMNKAQVNTLQKNILLLDHTKFGKTALLTYAKVQQFDSIIYTKKMPQKYLDFFKEHQVNLIPARA